MPNLPKEISDFMTRFNVQASELWEVRGGAWAIKHKAIERVAAEQNIKFAAPTILFLDMQEKIAAIIVTGTMGERSEWSTGEAAPYNNKNTYPLAMAEKRAKDRVTLKLLSAHGALYSEDEADDFKQNGPATLAKKDAKDIYSKMQTEVRDCKSRDQLRDWMTGNKDRIQVLPDDWQTTLRSQCFEMLADLKQREAA